MAGINFNEIDNIKGAVDKISNRGFGYFIKNVGIVVLIFIILYIFANPEILRNPEAYFATFDRSSFFSIGVLFVLVGGVYQLASSILKDNRKYNDNYIAKEVISEQRRYDDKQKMDHLELVKSRIRSTPVIMNALKDIIIDLGATRVCVFEMHNGTNSLVGLPFLYADVTYEEVGKGLDYMKDEFKNFSLSRYPFVLNHFEDGTWIGSIEEMSKEDSKLASKLDGADTDFAAFVLIQGIDAPIGFLTVSFKDEHPSKTDIMAEINQKVQIISGLLDARNN